MIGHVNITPYFADFIKDKPVVEIDRQAAKIGGVCGIAAFASGLYTFKLNGGAILGDRRSRPAHVIRLVTYTDARSVYGLSGAMRETDWLADRFRRP